jgi:hypothetical protein
MHVKMAVSLPGAEPRGFQSVPRDDAIPRPRCLGSGWTDSATIDDARFFDTMEKVSGKLLIVACWKAGTASLGP